MSANGDWKDLLKAAGQGDVKLTRFHLRGTDPNFQHPEYFTCPIFEAIRNGHLEIVRILVEEGNADPSLTEEFSDQTPVEVALDERKHDIVDYLISKLPPDCKTWNVRQVLVTGGNHGLGKEMCTLLLHQGHRVMFTCCSKEAGQETVHKLISATQNCKVDYIVGDLSSIQSVKALAKAIQARFSTINVLLLNASIWPTEKIINEDGLEMTFMVNYMAPYLLTRELRRLLERNSPSRIVLVTEKLCTNTLLFGKSDLTTTPYGKDFHSVQTYMKTKCCCAFFLLSLAIKSREEGDKITINLIDPGIRQRPPNNSCIGYILKVIRKLWLTKPSDGAAAAVWLAVSTESEGFHGQFYDGTMKKIRSLADLPVLLDQAVQADWEQWTADFISRKD